LAQDLSKGTRRDSEIRILRTVCLCDSVPSLTAWANDDGYEWVFFQQVITLGRPGDLLIAVSGSGNSPNILHAVNGAHSKQMRTWGITGFDGGQLRNLAHRCVRVPHDDMGRVEAAHAIIFHWLVDYLREMFQASRERRLSDEAWVPQ
jgi:D-sedoheptulose 7-phosphate isomerase